MDYSKIVEGHTIREYVMGMRRNQLYGAEVGEWYAPSLVMLAVKLSNEQVKVPSYMIYCIMDCALKWGVTKRGHFYWSNKADRFYRGIPSNNMLSLVTMPKKLAKEMLAEMLMAELRCAGK